MKNLLCLVCGVGLLFGSGAPAATLVPFGAQWRYLDDGTDQGEGWRSLAFSDAGWSLGEAELGYGEGDEATVVSFGIDPGDKHITTYFRHSFFVEDPAEVGIPEILLRRDDGAIVYLNGVEVFRSNIGLGAVDYLTLAQLAGDDGILVQSASVGAGILVAGNNLLAVEVHQNAGTSSDLTFDLSLLGESGNVPPTVTLTSPSPGQPITVQDGVTLSAVATDPDDGVVLVEFFAGNRRLGQVAGEPYDFYWYPPVPGAVDLTARATDLGGNTTVTAPVRVEVLSHGSGMELLIPLGSVWGYLDDGSDQGTAWRGGAFNDGSWSQGPAELGYGDGDEATVVSFGPDGNAKPPTTYFRRRFAVGAGAYSDLLVRLKRDDGAIVYLNGVEVFRSNMPGGAVDYLTLTGVAADDGELYYEQLVDAALLVPGTNVLAVEIHQAALNSSDISFNLELYGRRSILVTHTGDSGAGSLREAINESNANSGRDTIVFDLAGLPPFTFQPETALPQVSDPVVIDGWSQPGFVGTPIIELEGGVAAAVGLEIVGADSVVRGLAINDFAVGIFINGGGARRNWIYGNYIGIDGAESLRGNLQGLLLLSGAADNVIGTDGDGVGDQEERNVIGGNTDAMLLVEVNDNRVAGNYIGTDSSGTVAHPNTNGVSLFGGLRNILGTDSSDDPHNANERNLLSGNQDRAVLLDGANQVSGNWIGVDVTGLYPLPNQFGIQVTGVGGVVGSDADGVRDDEEGNVISASSISGIVVRNPETGGTRISGNLIGTDATGIGAVPNWVGVHFFIGPVDCVVGGVGGGLGNVIAYNLADGVILTSEGYEPPLRISILGNSIHSNGGLGIALGSDGVTANDLGDADSGENALQNFPELTSAFSDGSGTSISGTLTSVLGVFRIEFFSSPAGDPSGYGEGEVFLGAASVEKDEGVPFAMAVPFSVDLPAGVEAGHVVTATATRHTGETSEFSAFIPVVVGGAPLISEEPMSQTVSVGGLALFCVTVAGPPPIRYQWRRNGVNIEGATNDCLQIAGVMVGDGGAYGVVVANAFGAVASSVAYLVVDVNFGPIGDDFVDRVLIVGQSGFVAGTNNGASKEVGEPDHAGKPGGRSVWYRWQAPATGIATFRTEGSSFDTLLAVYEGSSVLIGDLTLIADDEDSGPSLTSRVQFNAEEGQTYQIAIDGFNAAEGAFVLSWDLEVTGAGDALPVILSDPVGGTVAPGAGVVLSVTAADSNPIYEWWFNGALVPGAAEADYAIPNVQGDDVGNYWVVVQVGNRRVRTKTASLQLNLTAGEAQQVRTEDKLLDVTTSGAPLRLGRAGGGSGGGQGTGGAALSLGYTGTQTFNTSGSTTEQGEPNHCNVIGGASQWFVYLADEEGELFLNTDGSTFDTVMAVYTGDGVDFGTLEEVSCDNDGGLDGRDSSLRVATLPGTVYLIAVDGVDAQTGLLFLNYSLVLPGQLSLLPFTSQGFVRLRLIGREQMIFRLEGSGDLNTWFPLLEGSSPSGMVDFIDTESLAPGLRLYRAVMFP